jgi:hypothetical protein
MSKLHEWFRPFRRFSNFAAAFSLLNGIVTAIWGNMSGGWSPPVMWVFGTVAFAATLLALFLIKFLFAPVPASSDSRPTAGSITAQALVDMAREHGKNAEEYKRNADERAEEVKTLRADLDKKKKELLQADSRANAGLQRENAMMEKALTFLKQRELLQGVISALDAALWAKHIGLEGGPEPDYRAPEDRLVDAQIVMLRHKKAVLNGETVFGNVLTEEPRRLEDLVAPKIPFGRFRPIRPLPPGAPPSTPNSEEHPDSSSEA